MEKKKYIKPRIELIFLDNEISLALESSPPSGPNEIGLVTPKHLIQDPFNSNLA